MKVKCCRLFVAFGLSICLASSSFGAPKSKSKKLARDPQAPAVEFFDAVEKGTIESTVIAKDAHAATVFITNKSNTAVNVQFPQVVIAAPVMKQIFGQGRAGGAPGQGNGMGGGGTQTIGGGMMQGQNGMGMGMGNGQQGAGMMNGQGAGIFNVPSPNGNLNNRGVFSVPSQKTVQVSLTTVCLSHGLPDPRPKLKYQLVKFEDYSKDRVLHATLKSLVAGETSLEAAQAAAWHLTDNLSWDDLQNKQIEHLAGDSTPFFSEGTVDHARRLIQYATTQASAPEPAAQVIRESRRSE